MEVILCVIVALVVLALIYKSHTRATKIYNEKMSVIIDASTNSAPLITMISHTEAKEESMVETAESAETKKHSINYYVFRDHYGENIEDYSYLTPAEARKEMNERKEAGEYIPSEEYIGYMNVIKGANDDDLFAKIDEMSPEACLKWFNRRRASDTYTTSVIWQAVGEKVAPMHEPELLEMLSKVTGGRVEGWVSARKQEGYFFTEEVYSRALQLRTEYVMAQEQKQSKAIVRDLSSPPDIPDSIIEKVKADKSFRLSNDHPSKENMKRTIRYNRKKMEENQDNDKYRNLYFEHVARYNLITGEVYY